MPKSKTAQLKITPKLEHYIEAVQRTHSEFTTKQCIEYLLEIGKAVWDRSKEELIKDYRKNPHKWQM